MRKGGYMEKLRPAEGQNRQPGIQETMRARADDIGRAGSGRIAGRMELVMDGKSGIGFAVAIARYLVRTEKWIRGQGRRRQHLLLLVAVLTFSPASFAAADVVKVRYPESTAHGFVILRDLAGKTLARGELTQWPERDGFVNRLVFRFNDGSLYDEQLRFSQKTVLRLLEYHLVQRGPSFKEASDVKFDGSGRYQARQRSSPDAEEESASGTVEIPRISTTV